MRYRLGQIQLTETVPFELPKPSLSDKTVEKKAVDTPVPLATVVPVPSPPPVPPPPPPVLPQAVEAAPSAPPVVPPVVPPVKE